MEASPRLPLAASRVRQKIAHPEEEMEGKGGKGRGGIQVRCQYSVSSSNPMLRGRGLHKLYVYVWIKCEVCCVVLCAV